MPLTGTRSKSNSKSNHRCHQNYKPRDDQDDELMALASIYDSDVFYVEEKAYRGHFYAHVELLNPLSITGINVKDNSRNLDTVTETGFLVKYLPPIILQFKLPHNYPLQKMPGFLLRCKWLNMQQLSCLCKCLDKLWYENQNEVVLFRWAEFLQKESLTALNIIDCLDLSWVTKDLSLLRNFSEDASKKPLSLAVSCDKRFSKTNQSSRNYFEYTKSNNFFREDHRAIADLENVGLLFTSLKEFNQMQIEKHFNVSFHYCSVCFEEKSGSMCTIFKECGHIYCKECIKSYFEVQIVEGKVTALNCPFDKCKTQAIPSHVRDLVGTDLYEKYDRFLLSTTLDSMPDIHYCPRPMCQCAVVIEPGCTMGSCAACFFVFCIFCRMSYHGIEACRLKSDERRALYEKYVNGTMEEKKALESRYGKLQIQHLVDSTLSDSWIDENSKPCPHCRSSIEKIDGCNKMSCWKCGKYFCWTCMEKLSETVPYKHYEDPKAGCFNRLFTGAFANVEEDENFEDLEDDDGELGEYLLFEKYSN